MVTPQSILALSQTLSPTATEELGQTFAKLRERDNCS